MDKIYWFITVFEKFDNQYGIKNARTWGFYSDKEKALETLKHNYTDLWETVYDYAVLEPYYEGIIGVTEEELVSSDFIGDPHSCIVDLPLIDVVGGNMIKVVAWYDNEWGYSNRLVELAVDFGKGQ